MGIRQKHQAGLCCGELKLLQVSFLFKNIIDTLVIFLLPWFWTNHLQSCPTGMVISHTCGITSDLLYGRVLTASRSVLESSFQDAPLCFIFGFSPTISSCTSKSLMPLNSLSNSIGILSFSFLLKKYLQLTAPKSLLLFCNLEVLNIDLITTLPPLPIGVLLHC